MKYRVIHTTEYSYSSPASLSQNELFLAPRDTVSQKVLRAEVKVRPNPQYFNRRTDYFGNQVHTFMVQHPHNKLSITASSVVETGQTVSPEPAATIPWEQVKLRLRRPGRAEELEAFQYCFFSPMIGCNRQVQEYARLSFTDTRPVLDAAIDLMHRVYTEFTYDKNASTVDTTVEQVLIHRKGVCQDFAHFCVSCLRSLGLAARYVSGYLETIPPEGQPKLVGADASHAWLAIYIPDFGWVDLDPTNDIIPNDTYITVAWGRDYSDVAPVKGVVTGGGIHELGVQVDVSRLI